MGLANGGSDIYFGTHVRKWGATGAGNVFFGLPKGGNFFLTPCVYPQNAQIFVEHSKWVNNTQRIRRSDPTSKLALGCWPIHLSPVTRGGGGGAP